MENSFNRAALLIFRPLVLRGLVFSGCGVSGCPVLAVYARAGLSFFCLYSPELKPQRTRRCWFFRVSAFRDVGFRVLVFPVPRPCGLCKGGSFFPRAQTSLNATLLVFSSVGYPAVGFPAVGFPGAPSLWSVQGRVFVSIRKAVIPPACRRRKACRAVAAEGVWRRREPWVYSPKTFSYQMFFLSPVGATQRWCASPLCSYAGK
jgi:hypothetical protein